MLMTVGNGMLRPAEYLQRTPPLAASRRSSAAKLIDPAHWARALLLSVLLCIPHWAFAQRMAWRNLLPQGVEFIYAIALDPTNSSTIYGGTSYGVIMSTDGGRTWFTAFYLPAAFVQAVAVDPNTPNTAYAGTQGSGVFKTSDGGNSWNAMNDGIE